MGSGRLGCVDCENGDTFIYVKQMHNFIIVVLLLQYWFSGKTKNTLCNNKGYFSNMVNNG